MGVGMENKHYGIPLLSNEKSPKNNSEMFYMRFAYNN